uniref:Putative secreted protein n=1 Tax=Ixodes ricinus TaxID=34613 RepID=A0A6B0UKT6_IXORI
MFLLLSLIPLLCTKGAAALLRVRTLPFHISWLFFHNSGRLDIVHRLAKNRKAKSIFITQVLIGRSGSFFNHLFLNHTTVPVSLKAQGGGRCSAAFFRLEAGSRRSRQYLFHRA